MRDFLDTFGRHPPPAQHVREKRPDVGGTLRTAEGDQQHGIERV